MEIVASSHMKLANVPLCDLDLPEGVLIAAIHRGQQVIIPDGNSCIQRGDNVIVVTTHKQFDDLMDIFA